MCIDQALARRLERAEGAANAGFVESRARMMPETGAEWIEVAGTYAMFDGPRSPCTQTFGLGLFAMPTPAEMETLERFFRERGAAVYHEVSPLADKAVLPLLNERGYRPCELSNVLILALDAKAPRAAIPEPLTVRVAGKEEMDAWVRTAAEGWREFVEIADQLGSMMRVSAARAGFVSFFAEWNGAPIATGALAVHDGVALLAGASTIPEWRQRGAQRALFGGRLDYAARAGCDLAMVVAEPGAATQRNAERQGFRVAYTRTKWVLGD